MLLFGFNSIRKGSCRSRFLGRCSIKQVGHHGWLKKKILGFRSPKIYLNYIFSKCYFLFFTSFFLFFFLFYSSSILIVYCALQVNWTFSQWSALHGIFMAACVMYASHNFTKTNIKSEFQKCVNSRKHQVSSKFITITSVWEKKLLFDQAF